METLHGQHADVPLAVVTHPSDLFLALTDYSPLTLHFSLWALTTHAGICRTVTLARLPPRESKMVGLSFCSRLPVCVVLHLCRAGGCFPGPDASSFPWRIRCVSTHAQVTGALCPLRKCCLLKCWVGADLSASTSSPPFVGDAEVLQGEEDRALPSRKGVPMYS